MSKESNNNINQNKQVNIVIQDTLIEKRSMEIPPMPKIKPTEQPQDKKN